MVTNQMQQSETEVREQVRREMLADAVDVEIEGDETTVSLYYHEPEARKQPVLAPFGIAIAITEPDVEGLMAELIDDIYQQTSPDNLSVEDKDGFYVIELTYEDGNSW